jgi:hypothetical protein
MSNGNDGQDDLLKHFNNANNKAKRTRRLRAPKTIDLQNNKSSFLDANIENAAGQADLPIDINNIQAKEYIAGPTEKQENTPHKAKVGSNKGVRSGNSQDTADTKEKKPFEVEVDRLIGLLKSEKDPAKILQIVADLKEILSQLGSSDAVKDIINTIDSAIQSATQKSNSINAQDKAKDNQQLEAKGTPLTAYNEVIAFKNKALELDLNEDFDALFKKRNKPFNYGSFIEKVDNRVNGVKEHNEERIRLAENLCNHIEVLENKPAKDKKGHL